ncbi:hypothetical protein Pcinc_013263 [Petrolisthes cinctipes]|uniref:Uncharacterized protein n=1 Tax=Petrolisthes cinctipes TaxID=88211 RepID=A0AAE1FZ03_PETCI|nr:hypothetical protein Pcinc_013263 [Petrolisthes cinctipes]
MMNNRDNVADSRRTRNSVLKTMTTNTSTSTTPTTKTRSTNTITTQARNTAARAAVRKATTHTTSTTTTKCPVHKDASVALKKGSTTTTASPKRAAWDLRGRLLDTEAEITSFKTERDRFDTQLNT